MGEQKKGLMIIGDIPIEASIAAITDGKEKVEVEVYGNTHTLFRLFEGICEAVAKAALESYNQPYECREELDLKVIETMAKICVCAVAEVEKGGEE